MTYTSERKMASLALGLIQNSLSHYGHDADVEMKNIKDDGSVVRFIITCK